MTDTNTDFPIDDKTFFDEVIEYIVVQTINYIDNNYGYWDTYHAQVKGLGLVFLFWIFASVAPQ
jgi:hypothetical protein